MRYELIQNEHENLNTIERIFTNRGIKLENIEHYLNTKDTDIYSPSLLKNIHQGVKLLISHIAKENKIFIQVDSDADGFCSSAILINYLVKLFPTYSLNNISYRLHNGKEHGIILDTIPEGVKLVIIPDAGSNQFEEHKELAAAGIDVLVIDHHEAEQESPYACIINNQLCDYPTKSLCGGAMVLKFCQYIDSLLNKDYAEEYYDLASLALISDMMDIRDFETRHLITKGLNNIKNSFFKEMIKKQEFSLKDGLSPIGIAFYITPYINATIRVGTLKEKTILFEAMLEHLVDEAIPSTKRGCKGQFESRVDQACRNCMNIKKHQGQERDEEVEYIEKIIEKENLLENKILIIQLPEGKSNKNLTGLIANQLMSKYQKPVLLLNQVTKPHIFLEQDYSPITQNVITWEGSARNYDKSNFTNFKDFIAASGYAEYAEGHQSAFGAGFTEDNLDAFTKFSNQVLEKYDFNPNYKVDFIFDSNNFKGKDILDIAQFKNYWGQNLSEPLIAIENVKITKDNLILMSPDKNPTLKITLPNGTSLIKFKSSKEEYESLKRDTGCLSLNIIGTCNQNIWNGIVSPQVLIEDYEIEKEIKYYF